ncbi:MAG: hypothetical protein AAFQ86_11110 [Bacteroidota bacterium]
MPPDTTAVSVRPVASAGDARRFLNFAYEVPYYQGNHNWVPPLRLDQRTIQNPKKNAFFEHGRWQRFLAEDGAGNVLGRIAGIVNGMHLETYDDHVGFFGFFECIDRYDVAEALLDAAAAWLREQGLQAMRGPANPSLNDVAGLLMAGFDKEPMLLMPYNPPYYAVFLERYGFERSMTMWAYYVHRHYLDLNRMKRGAALVQRRYPDVTVRALDMNRYDEDVAHVLRIYNDAWVGNWGFVPITPSELKQLEKELKPVIVPDLVYFIEVGGEPVAFSVTLPNLNQVLKKLPDGKLLSTGLPKMLLAMKLGAVQEVRMPLMGVLPAYQGRGLDVLLVMATIEAGIPLGYRACEMSWVLDTNKKLTNLLDSFGSIRDKEYALFEKPL